MSVQMNVQAMNSAMRLMNGGDASLSGLLGSGASGEDFASILSALSGNSALSGLLGTGSGSGGLAGLMGGGADDLGLGQMDMSNVMAMYGLDWQSMQTSMMLEAMGKLQEATKPIVADPALAELLNRLSQSKAGGQASEAELLQLIGQMQKRLQEIVQEQGMQMAGQQMLAMMSQLGRQMTGVQMSDSTLEALGADGGQAMLNLALSSTPQQLADTITNLTQSAPATRTALATQTGPTTQAIPPGEAQPQAGAELTQTPAKAATPASFEAAVRTAKQQLSDYLPGANAEAKAEGEAKPKTDIDALQQQVDAGTYLRNTALAGNIGAPEAAARQPVQTPALQLADSLKLALQNGEERLTVKLAPESLGEVTIQLTKTADGMSLSIIAKNPETQAMLAGQIDQLRETMRPMNVEVGAVLTQQQYELQSGQQHANRERQHQPLRGAAYYGDEPLTAEPVAIPVQTAPATALDTYI